MEQLNGCEPRKIEVKGLCGLAGWTGTDGI